MGVSLSLNSEQKMMDLEWRQRTLLSSVSLEKEITTVSEIEQVIWCRQN